MPDEKSHLRDHPESIPLIQFVLGEIEWPDDTPVDKYVSFNRRVEGVNLGKSRVVAVPDRDDVRVVYAPRLDHNGRPRMQAGTQDLLYSRWVIGVTEDDKPDNHFIRAVLTRPPNQTEEEYWLQLITAYPNNGEDSPREAGSNFQRFPEHKNPALRYWEGVDADGTRVDRGHAFVFDPTQVDMGNVREDCPYDVTPHLSS
ncbi:MAG: hypothetical protein KatS3mg087_0382 [Patescibacteria group bacterium]|nr:MAG: hypothetical protein KatS3mg087_0382 [Patescibacteria group bacterium]